MKKSFLAVVTAAALCFSLAGCSQSELSQEEFDEFMFLNNLNNMIILNRILSH